MRRLLLPALAAALVATTAGCGGTDAPRATATTSAAQATAAAQDADGARQLDPAQFARSAADPATVTVDVHIPYQGEIDGTERFVPYTRIARAKLPAKDARIALYCRSGRMSAIAARQLRREGYTDLVELHGGMEAWTASGRTLAHRAGRPSA